MTPLPKILQQPVELSVSILDRHRAESSERTQDRNDAGKKNSMHGYLIS
jgi:hypothetical protein